MLERFQDNYGITSLEELQVSDRLLSGFTGQASHNKSPIMILDEVLEDIPQKDLEKLNPKNVINYVNSKLPPDRKFTEPDKLGFISLVNDHKDKMLGRQNYWDRTYKP